MQEGSPKLGDLTVSEILTHALDNNSEKAGQILSEIQSAIDNDLRGDELKKRIFELLCKYGIADCEVCQILLKSAKQVVTF